MNKNNTRIEFFPLEYLTTLYKGFLQCCFLPCMFGSLCL